MKEGGFLTRLEQGLEVWEGVCFIRQVNRLWAKRNGKNPDSEGRFIPWQDLRPFLSSCFGKPFDDRFFNPSEDDILQATRNIPFCFFSWINHSRRVYHLTSSMQSLLEATSLTDVRWSDIYWPFDSFVITLESPIKSDFGPLYDCILVSKKTGGFSEESDRLLITAFSSELDKYPKLNREDIPGILRAVKQGRHDTGPARRFERWNEAVVRIEENLIYDLSLKRLSKDSDIDYVLNLYRNSGIEGRGAAEIVTRLVLGICLLQQTKKCDTYIKRSEQVKKRTPAIKAPRLYSPAELFCVSCDHILPKGLKKVVSEIGQAHSIGKIEPHFRTGHWRRPPGKGDDPTQKKTVWVMPTIVNEEFATKEDLLRINRTILQNDLAK